MPDLAVDDGLEDAAAVIAGVRRRRFGIAYRLLASWTGAEDVVQDAWLRRQGTDRTQVRNPGAFPTTPTTRPGRTSPGRPARGAGPRPLAGRVALPWSGSPG